MFSEECFIRKNTLKLRKKLEKIGYSNGDMLCHSNYNKSERLSTFPYEGYYISGMLNSWAWTSTYHEVKSDDEFLAIASIRSDTDMNQIFVKDIVISKSGPAKGFGLFYVKSKVDKFKKRGFKKANSIEISNYYNEPYINSENYIKY
jgi:hypothetical protein